MSRYYREQYKMPSSEKTHSLQVSWNQQALSSRNNIQVQPEWKQFHNLMHPQKGYSYYPEFRCKQPRKVSLAARKGSKEHQTVIPQSRSVNRNVRSKEQRRIEQQNGRIVDRLNDIKSAYSTRLMNQKWKQQKSWAKNIANYPFVLRDNIYSQQSRRIQNNQATKDSSLNETIRIQRIRMMNGMLVTLMVVLDEVKLTIIANFRNGDPKVIQISREEAFFFIQEECNGNIQLIFDCLAFDSVNKVLFLLSKSVNETVS